MNKEIFMQAYNNHPPKKLVVWFFKYFSQSTKQEDKTLVNVLTWSWISSIFLGILFKATSAVILLNIVFFAFACTFVPFCIIGIYSALQNNIRIRKIAKELGLNLTGYNKYANLYLHEN